MVVLTPNTLKYVKGYPGQGLLYECRGHSWVIGWLFRC